MVSWNLRDTDGKTGALEISHCAGCKRNEGAHMVSKAVWHVPSGSQPGRYHVVMWDEEWGDWKCTCEGDYFYRLSKGKRSKCVHAKQVIGKLQEQYTPAPAPPPVKRGVTLLDLYD